MFLSQIFRSSVAAVALIASLAMGAEWIPPAQVSELEAGINPSPAAKSTVETDDLTQLLHYQRTRSNADCVRAASEVAISLGTFFGPAYGQLSPDEVAKYSQLFVDIGTVTRPIVDRLKARFNRARPYNAFPQIQPCIDRPVNSPSYPSGHTVLAMVWGRTLIEMFPERREALEKRIKEIAEDRVIGGVHYPSDIQGGKQIGETIFKALMKSDEFKKRLSTLKTTVGQN